MKSMTVPDRAAVIYSAHGVSPAVAGAEQRPEPQGESDATWPLVTKVHIEAVKFARQAIAGADRAPRPRRIEGTLAKR